MLTGLDSLFSGLDGRGDNRVVDVPVGGVSGDNEVSNVSGRFSEEDGSGEKCGDEGEAMSTA